MASSSTEKKMIVLISKEGQTFEVEEAAARLSQTVNNMIEDHCTAGGISLPTVDSPTMAKVIEFCNRHAAGDTANRSDDEDNLKKFDSDYIESVKDDQKMLFDLILAAMYMDIGILVDLTSNAVADMVRGKTPEEIRQHFHIKNDFSPQEEEEIRRENTWAFE